MALKPTVYKEDAEHVMKENQERIKLQARQITNRILNRTLHEHDTEFINRFSENGEIWEIGTVSREEIEGLFRKAALKELDSSDEV